MQIPVMVEDLLDEDIDVQLFKKDGTIKFDLQAHTKSYMHLVKENGGWYVEGRYGEKEEVEDIIDLLYIFIGRYKAKEFGSDQWLDLCIRHGLMKEEKTVTYTYKI